MFIDLLLSAAVRFCLRLPQTFPFRPCKALVFLCSITLICGLTSVRSFAQPSPPTGLIATPMGPSKPTEVQLTWNIVAGATSYNLYRSTTLSGEGNNPVVTNVSVTADGTQMVPLAVRKLERHETVC